MKCSGCGKDYEDSYQFCPFCGQKNEIQETSGEELKQGAAAPPGDPGSTPPAPPPPRPPGSKQPSVIPPPLPPPISASPASGSRKSISDRWRALSTKGKALVIGVGVFLLLVVIIGPFAGNNESNKSDVEGEPQVSETAEPEEEEAPEKTADDFITITNVSDGQQLTIGPSVIAGTANEECSITCNGQPVGFAEGSLDFAPTITINEGPNTISFEVTDSEGETYTKTLTIKSGKN